MNSSRKESALGKICFAWLWSVKTSQPPIFYISYDWFGWYLPGFLDTIQRSGVAMCKFILLYVAPQHLYWKTRNKNNSRHYLKKNITCLSSVHILIVYMGRFIRSVIKVTRQWRDLDLYFKVVSLNGRRGKDFSFFFCLQRRTKTK